MQVKRVGLGDPAVTPLLAGLGEELLRRYGPNEVLADADADEFEPPDGAFVVLVEGGRTLAGGGLRRFDATTAEVKRMWTSPADRRRGLASVVLEELEQVAVERGYTRVRLETGPAQPEAIALYRRRGYRDIPPYGSYEESLAFERTLRPTYDKLAGCCD